MPNNVIPISNYSIKSSDTFFFDNNIWMYIFCPLANFQKDKRQKIYSGLFSNLLSRKSHIYTNSLVLSEFANRYLRLDFDIAKRDIKTQGALNDYKRDFVGTTRYIDTAKDVKSNLLKITTFCQRSSDEFNSINLDTIFSLFTNIGFNDSYYLHLASKKGWIIVSDDSDLCKNKFADLNVTILTA